MAQMKTNRLGHWLAIVFGTLYFLLPLIATLQFSLRKLRGVYSFEAYRVVLADPQFQSSFVYSVVLAVITIVFGMAIIVPMAYFVELRLRRLRPFVEFVALLPLVVPAIVIVFGYLRLYNSSSLLPLTNTSTGTSFLLTCGYVTLALPYMYRSVETGLRAIDVRTLTEAAESLGASASGTIILAHHHPTSRSAVLSGAFLTFAIVIGEFTFASLLNRPAFGPYLQLIGANRAYEPAALAVMAFMITWACMGIIQVISRNTIAARLVRRLHHGTPDVLHRNQSSQEAFGANTVVHDFGLSIDKGEFVSFLGPSGCGKTTILRMIAGFETASSGTIHIGGAEVTRTCRRRGARSAWCSRPMPCSPT